MDVMRFKPLWYVLFAILGSCAIVLSGFMTMNWMISSGVGLAVYLTSYAGFYIKRRQIDNLFSDRV